MKYSGASLNSQSSLELRGDIRVKPSNQMIANDDLKINNT